MKRKNESRKRSLLSQTIESLKESENENHKNNFGKLNQKLFKKTYNKNYNRNSSLKIFSYNQKKGSQPSKNNKYDIDYCKNIFNKEFYI